eukprot:9131995-Prorocentrum_lima.AAC.1
MEGEAEAVGPHMFDQENITIPRMVQATEENRSRCVDFALANHLILANTHFRKPPQKLVTYREPGVARSDEIT